MFHIFSPPFFLGDGSCLEFFWQEIIPQKKGRGTQDDWVRQGSKRLHGVDWKIGDHHQILGAGCFPVETRNLGISIRLGIVLKCIYIYIYIYTCIYSRNMHAHCEWTIESPQSGVEKLRGAIRLTFHMDEGRTLLLGALARLDFVSGRRGNHPAGQAAALGWCVDPTKNPSIFGDLNRLLKKRHLRHILYIFFCYCFGNLSWVYKYRCRFKHKI